MWGRVEVSVHRVLVETPEGMRPLGRFRHRREDNLQEVECKGMGWIDLVQGRHTWAGVLNAVMNLQVP